MKDLSLHLLDLAENSIRAQAKKIHIELHEWISKNQLIFRICDDGEGMDEEMVAHITNPFMTTRTTRRVGLGIPLFYQNCMSAGGTFQIQSQPHKGIFIEAVMQYNHVDRLPIGDVASSLSVLIQGSPQIQLIYTHTYEDKSFVLDTFEIQKILGTISISEPEIILWLRSYIQEQIAYLSS